MKKLAGPSQWGSPVRYPQAMGEVASLKNLLQFRIPGPVPVPPRVMAALAGPAINHRGAEARAGYRRVQEGLRRLFGTGEEVVVLTGSGTAAMEAAVANTVEPDDRVLVLVGGKFGERWAEITQAFGARVEVLSYDLRRGADPQEVADRLRAQPGVKAVFATHNESSTAVMNDIGGIARAIREAAGGEPPLLVVDAISSLGGAPFHLDDWGVDVAVSGSQKCLMSPPGLSFVALGPRGWARVEEVRTPRYYLDLRAYRKSGRQEQWPYTQAVGLVRAVGAALDMIFEEGLEHVYARHRLLREMVRSAVRAMGLEPWVEDRYASPTLTALEVPAGVDGEALRARLRDELGVEIGGGQGELKGKILRIGHMGYAFPADMLAVLGALEALLHEAGAGRAGRGQGVAAAQEVWAQWQ